LTKPVGMPYKQLAPD